MKILALDLGDKWVGSAISDPLRITCKPYQTVEVKALETFLENTLSNEEIDIIVVGRPKTCSGGQSQQTLKIEQTKNSLEQQFFESNNRLVKWVFWDERLSSKRADSLKKGKIQSKEDKIKSHSIAASFILQSYLDYLASTSI
jgi:putative holliday junction resolvase